MLFDLNKKNKKKHCKKIWLIFIFLVSLSKF